MKNEKISLIATLPKSGTWYCHFFFWCYDQLLQHADSYVAGKFRPDFEGMLRERKMRNLSSYAETLGLDKLYICHSICPGFTALNDPRQHDWEALQFVIEDYNWGETNLRVNGEWDALNPALQPDAKIVYLYRNPLDHFVSFYRYSMAHAHDVHRVMIRPDGERVPVASLHDFIFRFGSLGAFIKQYYSFQQMHRAFPDNILMLPYERLTTTPATAFREILTFFGTPPEGELQQRLFDDALAMCSRESLSKLEQKMNMPLAHTMTNNEKHINGGETGKWQTALTQDELRAIETVFGYFGMSLETFALTEEGAPSTAVAPLTLDPVNQPIVDFFLGQMDRAGAARMQAETRGANADSKALRKVVGELRAAQNELLSSTSWKITAPLRRLGLLFRKKLFSQG